MSLEKFGNTWFDPATVELVQVDGDTPGRDCEIVVRLVLTKGAHKVAEEIRISRQDGKPLTEMEAIKIADKIQSSANFRVGQAAAHVGRKR